MPLFFNPRTERVFEPDKLAWVITLAILAGWGLTVALAARRPGSGRPARPQPLSVAIAAAGLALGVGTLASTERLVSLWGYYQRGQGALTSVAFLAMAVAAALTAGRPEALVRLRRVIVLAAVPAALYALFQRLQIDSIAWDVYGAAPAQRAFGPLGNPIFLGAYLVLVVPVMLVGLAESWQARRRGLPGQAPSIAGHAVALALALAALWAAQSRGPWLGLAAGLGLLALLAAARAGRKWLAAGLGALGALALALLVALGQTGGASLGRLGSLLAMGSRTASERLLVWEAILRLARSDPPRALIGHGPDTLVYALPRFTTDALVRLTPEQVFDRAHNVAWEWWLSAGVLGLLALLGLYAAAVHAGFRLLGLLAYRRAAWALAGCLAGGALLGCLLPAGLARPGLTAPGAALGLWVGAGLFLALAPWMHPPPPGAASRRPAGRRDGSRARPPADSRSLMTAAVLAALAAHLVEGTFGVPTVAGELLFWVYLGVLVAFGRPAPPAPAPASARADGLVDGLVLATVLFAPLLLPSPAALTMGRAAFLGLLLPVTWLAAELLSTPLETPGGVAWRNLYRLAVLGALALGFGLLRAPVGGPMLAFGLVLVGATLVLALLLAQVGAPGEAAAFWRWVVFAALAVLAGAAVWRLAWRPQIADAHVRAGLEAGVTGDLAAAQGHFEQAVTLWPEQPAYGVFLAAAYRETALDPAQPPAVRAQALSWAEQVLRRSAEQAADDQFMQRLGALFRDAGDGAATPGDQRQAWQQARREYERALAHNPRSPLALAGYAGVLERLGEAALAEAAYQAAADLNPADDDALAGWIRTVLARGDVQAAADLLDHALALNRDDPQSLDDALARGADLASLAGRAQQSQVLFLARTGQPAAAEQLLAQAESASPTDPTWRRLRTWLSASPGP